MKVNPWDLISVRKSVIEKTAITRDFMFFRIPNVPQTRGEETTRALSRDPFRLREVRDSAVWDRPASGESPAGGFGFGCRGRETYGRGW